MADKANHLIITDPEVLGPHKAGSFLPYVISVGASAGETDLAAVLTALASPALGAQVYFRARGGTVYFAQKTALTTPTYTLTADTASLGFDLAAGDMIGFWVDSDNAVLEHIGSAAGAKLLCWISGRVLYP